VELEFVGGSFLLRGCVFLVAPARRWQRGRRGINSSGLFLAPLVSALGVNGEASPILESMAGDASSYSGDVVAGPFAQGCGAAVG